jgi:hypothetical protein
MLRQIASQVWVKCAKWRVRALKPWAKCVKVWVRQVVRESFDKAYSAVIVAARAHEELCKKTEQLKNNPDAVEKLKRAKICTRHLENMFQVWE